MRSATENSVCGIKPSWSRVWAASAAECVTNLRLVRLWISSVSRTGWAAMSPKTAPLNISKPAGNFAPRYTHTCKYREWLRPQTMAPASPLTWSLTHTTAESMRPQDGEFAASGWRVGRDPATLPLAPPGQVPVAVEPVLIQGAWGTTGGRIRIYLPADTLSISILLNCPLGGVSERFDFRHCAASGSFCWLTCKHVWTELSKPRWQYLRVWNRRHLQVISVEITTNEGHVLGQRSNSASFMCGDRC